MAWRLLRLCALSLSCAWEVRALQCDGDFEQLKSGDVCTSTWDKLTKGTHQLLPTEPGVGFAWSVHQMNKHFHSTSSSKDWFDSHQFPIVLGGENFYLVDRHHHGVAIQLTGDADIFALDVQLYVVCDLRDSQNFWQDLADANYNILLARPDSPFSLPTAVPPSALPTSWAMEEFFDDMWRGLAGFASHTSDDDVRCYVKECTNFLDFEWAYVFNYATEVDQSLWPSGEVDVASFKQQFESMTYRPKESDVDLDAWASLANLVLPLCHSDSLNGYGLPSIFPSTTLQGWSTTPMPKDPSCPYSACSAARVVV
jgi:hypothetical protein